MYMHFSIVFSAVCESSAIVWRSMGGRNSAKRDISNAQTLSVALCCIFSHSFNASESFGREASNERKIALEHITERSSKASK